MKFLLTKEIFGFRFTNLKTLKLRNNQIESCEGLNRIQLPLLESFSIGKKRKYLDWNLVNKMMDMRKCYWPHLSLCYISKKQIIKITIRSINFLLFPTFLPSINFMLNNIFMKKNSVVICASLLNFRSRKNYVKRI